MVVRGWIGFGSTSTPSRRRDHSPSAMCRCTLPVAVPDTPAARPWKNWQENRLIYCAPCVTPHSQLHLAPTPARIRKLFDSRCARSLHLQPATYGARLNDRVSPLQQSEEPERILRICDRLDAAGLTSTLSLPAEGPASDSPSHGCSCSSSQGILVSGQAGELQNDGYFRDCAACAAGRGS
ncbi:hypothetical protein PYCCODRAFT_706994 [Trametes coccinea BRFM310]|uniref:Uncharacterized protein n=1 Tax=Trametes coccinea (strain BRFM310) TaxID=1353009 RepID=A0A1Y2IHW2_TRAC3|nr:hypothetical protein PYCCODRAFT_706994 [Trametes coccinea BRFM310]